MIVLNYDIPQEHSDRNPSNELREWGVRLQFSSWLLMDGAVPYELLAGLREIGATVDLLELSDNAAANHLAIAARCLRNEIRQMSESAREIQGRLDGNLDSPDGDPNELLKRYRYRTAQTIKKKRDEIRQYEKVAQRFNLSPKDIGLTDAVRTIDTVREHFAERAFAYRELIRSLEQQGEESQAMAEALQTLNGDQATIALIAADMVQENGDDETAERVRSAFGL